MLEIWVATSVAVVDEAVGSAAADYSDVGAIRWGLGSHVEYCRGRQAHDGGGVKRLRLFISYANRDDRDRALAERLASALRPIGVSVWLAPDSIPAGDEWRDSLIKQVLSESTHFLVLLSSGSITSEWVLAEIALAEERFRQDPDFRVLPLVAGRLGDYPGREFIERFQRVPHRDLFSDQLTEVAQAIGTASLMPTDIAELISDKTESFVGRENVFQAIDEFIATERRGYITVLGDPGAGKTTILAEYVRRTGSVAHFNIRGQSLNTTGHFIHNLSGQLAVRYGITAVAHNSGPERYGEVLARLLTEARSATAAGEPLVLVVDALDEVNTAGDPGGANVLLLPRHLPSGVYFLLSSRRTRLALQSEAPTRMYDIGQHDSETMADIREYVRRMSEGERLRVWIRERDIGVDSFVETLAEKSGGNFMYLRHVLPELEAGGHTDLTLDQLPQGLEQYYEVHWQIMGMSGAQSSRIKVWVIYLLCEFARPVSVGALTRVVQEVEPSADAIGVQDVIEEWKQFLHREPSASGPRYSLYHTSFRDFLHRKDIIYSAGLALNQVNGAIADVLWRHEQDRSVRR